MIAWSGIGFLKRMMKMYRSNATVEVRVHRNQTHDESCDERYLDNQSKSNQSSNHKINNTCISLKKKNFDITAKDIQNDLKKSRKITCTTRTRSRTDQNRNMFEKIGPEYNSRQSWMFSRFKCESLMHASRLRRMEKRQSVPGIYFVNHEEHGTGTFWYAAHRCLYTGLN